MTETAAGSLEFESGDESLNVLLEEAPEFGSEELVFCRVADTAEGVGNAWYTVGAKYGEPMIYEALTPAIELSAPEWSDTELNKITLSGKELLETDIGTRIFTDEKYKVEILDGAPQTPEVDVWRILLTDGQQYVTIKNALFVVEETGPTTRLFRNCDPPILTNLPLSELEPEDHVPWRVKIVGLDIEHMESLVLKTNFTEITVTEFIEGSIYTKDLFILVPPGTTQEQVPGDFKLLHIDTDSIGTVLSQENMVEVKAELAFLWGCSPAPVHKRHPLRSAQVLRGSLRGTLQPLFIGPLANAVENLGYSVVKTNYATKQWALDNVIDKDVVVWFGHGAVGGVDYNFSNAITNDIGDPTFGMRMRDGAIVAEDLQPLNLDTRFALILGCLTGWTGGTISSQSRNMDTIIPEVQHFAKQFGSNVAYVGCSFQFRPGATRNAGVELLDYLKGGRTVNKAIAEYDMQNSEFPGVLKGYSPGNGLSQPVDADYIDWENGE